MKGTPLTKQTKKVLLVYNTTVNKEIEKKLRKMNAGHQVDLLIDACLRIIENLNNNNNNVSSLSEALGNIINFYEYKKINSIITNAAYAYEMRVYIGM